MILEIGGKLTNYLQKLIIIPEVIAFILLLVFFDVSYHQYRKRKKGSLPIRTEKSKEIFGPIEWEQQMMNLAHGHTNVKWMKYNFIVGKYNQEAYKRLNFIRFSISEVSSDIISLIPSARWLFDNFQMMYREIKKVKTTGTSYKTLPILRSGEYKGYPRIYVLAKKMVDFSGGYLNEENLSIMLTAYQKELPLTDKELWALPEMIGLSIIESIIEVSEDIIQIINIKANADRFVKEKLIIKENYLDITSLLHKVPGSFEENISFHCHVIYLLKNMSVEEEDIQKYIRYFSKAETEISNSSEIFKKEGKIESFLEANIRTLIVSLREINQMDNEKLFEELSLLENILLKDPDGIYPIMDFESRGMYRALIEKFSQKHKIEETLVGEVCVQLAIEGRDDLNNSHHVGAYLIGKGYPILKAHVRKRRIPQKLIKKHNFKSMLYIVLGNILLITVYALFFLISGLATAGNIYIDVIFLLVLTPISIGIALELTSDVAARIVPAQRIPALDYIKEIPDSARTFVVMPVIISTKEQGIEYINRLHKYYLANRQPNLYYALLVDYSDSIQSSMPEDEGIKNALADRIMELNEQYPSQYAHFSLFIRFRKWNESEDCYMGWERKRGKLEEFNALLNGEPEETTTFSTLLYDRELIGTFKYVITLDADSNLILNNAARMVGLIDHPLNRAIMDSSNRKIREGYAIIQPSVRNHIADKRSSRFTKICSGQTGISSYSTVTSDIYQDIFDDATYVGKGIYNVQIFYQIMNKSIPENSVLSHDLLESCYVKTAFDSTVHIMDKFPNTILAYAKRENRWIRGDWQLLPWLIKNKKLDAISKWKILDNMRRSMMPMCKTLFIILNLICLPSLYYLWIPIVLFSDILNLGMVLLSAAIYKIRRPKLKMLHKSIRRDLLFMIQRAFLEITLAPYLAYVASDAILRTLYRVIISKKNLLKWKSSENVEKSITNTKKSYFQNMWISCIPAGIVIGVLLVQNIAIPGVIIYMVVALAWGFSYYLAFVISQPNTENIHENIIDKEEILNETAKRTWQFFKDFAKKETNWLCPDNYQITYKEKITNKTSPTNIGLQFLAILSAKDLGFETLDSTISSVEKLMTTIELLPKFKGHLFNWYNINTLEVLDPQYISTVDSGNFFGYLIALKNGLLEQKEPESETEMNKRIDGLGKRIDVLLENAEFGFLYNKKRMLFHIGFHVPSQVLDNGYYDLMASESMLTSFLAIARGEVSTKHWYKLGRPLTIIKGIPAFVSWSGTMFEYLLPNLIMKSYEGSVFSETSKAAVIQQMKYAKHMKIPWGISESQYNGFDLDSNYQYRAFGVSGLRLQPSLTKSLVVAPYATMLALEYATEEALSNLKKMKELGSFGKYGYYEAIDYNAPDSLNLLPYCIVKSYMAHHQGMSLVAINNFLNNGIMRKRFHAEPIVKATEIILEEKRQTYFVAISKKGYAIDIATIGVKEEDTFNMRCVSGTTPKIPVVNYLSNGNYSLMMTSDGDGFSNYMGMMLYKWRADVYANTGNYIYIKDVEDGKIWSTTYHPTKAEPDKYKVVFLPYQSEFVRTDGDITTNMVASLSLNHNLEIRKVKMTNHGKEEKHLELTSYLEVVGDRFLAELGHPAFSKLFIESEFIEENSIFLSRRRNDKDSKNPYIMHLVKSEITPFKSLEYENDRMKFIGRNNTVQNPEAVTESISLSNSTGFSNDPIMSLRVSISLPAGQTACVAFITGVCESKEEAIKIGDELSVAYRVNDMFEKFRRQSEMELKYLNITKQQLNAFQDIISPIYYPSSHYRGPAENIRRNWKNQSFLWRFGVSGDNPIMLLRVSSIEEAGLIRNVLKAFEYLRTNQVKVDLIVLSEAKYGYMQELTELLNDMISSLKIYNEDKDKPSLFILHSYQMGPAEVDLLFTVARVVFTNNTGIYFRNIKENLNITTVK